MMYSFQKTKEQLIQKPKTRKIKINKKKKDERKKKKKKKKKKKGSRDRF